MLLPNPAVISMLATIFKEKTKEAKKARTLLRLEELLSAAEQTIQVTKGLLSDDETYSYFMQHGLKTLGHLSKDGYKQCDKQLTAYLGKNLGIQKQLVEIASFTERYEPDSNGLR